MYWLVFGVAVFTAALVWACCSAAKQADEAMEELTDRVRQLHLVASSVSQTSGRRARLARQRAQPFRLILQNVPAVEQDR